MESRIMQVFYGNDCLPYKDSARSVHYPIVGNSFIGASNTTQIRFYVRDIGGVNNVSWVAISKLPNGKIGNQVLSTIALDSELNEYYVALDLSSYYTQLKGDVYISLNGYQGGVQVEEDEDTGIYTIVGTPIIEATGSIKLAINYAPQLPLGQHFNISDIQQMLGLISEKANIVNTVQIVADISQEDLSGYDDGQLFYDITTQSYYEKDLSVASPHYVLAENYGILGSKNTLIRTTVSDGSIPSDLYDTIGLNRMFVLNYIDQDCDYIAKFIQENSNLYLVLFTFDNNGELQVYKGEFDNTYDFIDLFGSLVSVKFVHQTSDLSVIYATDNDGEQTTLTYSVLVGSGRVVQRDGSGQINVPDMPDASNKATSKKYVDETIATIKANQFIVINADDYDPLQDFLDNYPNPQEGYIYLYPINKNDLSKGYYQYIWEGSAWLDIGTTQIDLSNYYTKSESDTKFVAKTNSGEKVYGTDELGAQTTYSVDSDLVGDGEIVRRESGSGRVVVGTPTSNTHATTKGYVDTKDALKLDKTSNVFVLYATDLEGEQTTVEYNQNATGFSIVQRDSNGQVDVPLSPTNNAHASSKKYVDDSVSNAITNVYKIKGSATVAQINAMTNQQVGDVYNVTDSGTINAGSLQVFTGDNIVWTGSAWDKLGAEIDWTAYDEKFIAAGFFEVQPYNESTGEITFVYSTELYIMSYDSDTGIMTIQAN